MSITFIALLLMIGYLSAVFGSIVGLGGGIIIIPSLMYLAPTLLDIEISHPVAVGTSMAVLIVTSLSSTLQFRKQKRVDEKSAISFFVTSGLAAMLGASVTALMNTATFELSFGIFMLFVSLLLIFKNKFNTANIHWKQQKTYIDEHGQSFTYGHSHAVAMLIGLLVGFLSGLFGVGGGSLFVPAMIILFRYPPHVATATSMFIIFLSAILGTVSHYWQGNIDITLALILAVGAWFGGITGAKITTRMSSKALLWTLRISFLVIAIRLIIKGILA
ncbi:sulfite exporter TauE/SafE family protein [Longirhabdus pacifica]|uniref:sulfite exporter TauE/SafE family protein n=1 Tax=Longirhabdus pacifica TaxID=2305227 RepID=UPI001008EC9C|nr:sulfite exporter TauE/SafE family protein [Longirhabdus pacifica]